MRRYFHLGGCAAGRHFTNYLKIEIHKGRFQREANPRQKAAARVPSQPLHIHLHPIGKFNVCTCFPVY